MRALSDANALVTSPAQFLANWEYLRTVLGPDHFLRHTRRLLDREASRQRILAGLEDPQLALDSLAAADAEEVAPYLSDVQKAAATILRSASAANWEAALMSTETQPLVSLAVLLSGTKAAPTNPTGLQDGMHAHFQALASGEEAWHPDGATFAKLTRLLGGPARRVLALSCALSSRAVTARLVLSCFRRMASSSAGRKDSGPTRSCRTLSSASLPGTSGQ
jgi:hypothetical protein